MKKIVIAPEGFEDLNEALEFYLSKSPKIAHDFYSIIEYSLKTIQNAPKRWKIIENSFRSYVISRFPFKIIYFEEENEIIVIAIAHLKRNPDYWKTRI